MHLPRLFIKAAIPIVSIFLILAGIILLRAQFWVVGAICIILTMVGLIFSILHTRHSILESFLSYAFQRS